MRNKFSQEILDRITPEEHLEYEKQMLEEVAYHEDLKKRGKVFGTNTSITLNTVKEAGHSPIGICDWCGEETVIFNTKKEAHRAYQELEKKGKRVYAWWYSKKDFEKEVGDFQSLKIYWLL